MISQLSIENFALIEKLEIGFSGGFSIITGETGAGKSILLGALGLALGKRADLSALKDTSRKCVVEAHFNIADYALEPFFAEHDLDFETHTILRREILPGGKSRAFVNDSPVNLQQLQLLGNHLLDIHSQHQTLDLAQTDFQFKLLDALAGHNTLLADYQLHWERWRKCLRDLDALVQQQDQLLKEQDYFSFLRSELQALKLKAGEARQLEADLQRLGNTEGISQALDRVLATAQDDTAGVLVQLGDMRAGLQKLSGFDPTYAELELRVQSTFIELDDIVSELRERAGNLQQDPKLLEEVSARLQAIYHLQKKHQVTDADALLQVQSDLERRNQEANNLEDTIIALTGEKDALLSKLESMAAQLHENRKRAASSLTQKLEDGLSTLGMASARFDMRISPQPECNAYGKDALDFMFAANKGSGFAPLKKVASGGELSRIMLVIKAVLAEYSKLPTILFDEIDTGVSGETAHKMGEIMMQMSKRMQVFAITHLPQIAAKGDAHFKVYKTEAAGQTTSELRLLETEARVMEIAQMLSGADVSESALIHARALLT